MTKCKAITLKGKTCKVIVKEGNICNIHKYKYMECSICIHVKPIYTLKTCGHQFCFECIEYWESIGNYKCPICRKPFIDDESKICNKIQELLMEMSEVICIQRRFENVTDIFTLLSLENGKKIIREHEKLHSIILNKFYKFKWEIETYQTLHRYKEYIYQWKVLLNIY
jgi:hypothetical protein